MAVEVKKPDTNFRADFKDKGFRRRERIIELTIFLFLIAPSMAFSFFLSGSTGGGPTVGFTLTAVSSILRDLALVGLIMFFLWRNGESLKTIGWNLKGAGTEVAVGLGLFIPFFIAVALIENLLQMAGFTIPAAPMPELIMTGRSQLILALALVSVVAIAEETIFRGYLIQRFSSLNGSGAASVLLAGLIFSLGHGYEGSAGVVTVGIIGIFFGFVFLWRKSIIAPIVMHFMLDFVSIVLLPMLKVQ
jgi:membrane protease YdiL (CAAX protease family)